MLVFGQHQVFPVFSLRPLFPIGGRALSIPISELAPSQEKKRQQLSFPMKMSWVCQICAFIFWKFFFPENFVYWRTRRRKQGSLSVVLNWNCWLLKNSFELRSSIFFFLKRRLLMFSKRGASLCCKRHTRSSPTYQGQPQPGKNEWCWAFILFALQDALEVMEVSEWWIADLTDVTLVCYDMTYWRLGWCYWS